MEDPVITAIARRVNKTPAQVLLAWAIQRGTALLAPSKTPSRIKENFEVSTLPETAMREMSEGIKSRVRFNTVVETGVPGFIPRGKWRLRRGCMKPFRFGVNVRDAASRAEWVDKARRVENLGYSSLTLPDHLADMLAPIPAVVSAAEATKRLRVGTNVLNNDLRHPVMVAREAATVDVLSDGRLDLGLGAAGDSEYDEAGFPFDPGATSVERLAEQ